MENALLVGLSRQVALRREMDVIANNVANVNTFGFKAEAMLFQEYLMPAARTDAFPRGSNTVAYVQDRATVHDFRNGPVERTGNMLDVAIATDGFFAVETPAGERYTRNGSFQINAQGQLVTSEGQPVLGQNGPITFEPNDHAITIAADGTVSTAEGIRGKLRVVRFADPQLLKKDGTSTFAPEAGRVGEPVAQPGLVQGAIEKSNVRPVIELARMMEVQRAYQTVSSLIDQGYQMRRTAIERLAEAPM